MARDRYNRPLRDLRISVIDACNFRCPYCMPADEYPELMNFFEKGRRLTCDQILRLARLFADLGVRKIRLTGGEPLLRKDLPDIVAGLRRIDGIEDIAMTTNAYHLSKHAATLRAAGLSRVTVSLDSVDPAVFARMSGHRGDLGRVLDGLRAARDAGLSPIKANVVVQRGMNDHTIEETAEHFRDTGVVVRFIEYMDVGNHNGWEQRDVVSAEEIRRRIDAVHPLEPVSKHEPGEVANRYRYVDGRGEIGLIASVTQPFCGACTRARLSSDGQLYTCLFASRGVDLRTPLLEGASDHTLRDRLHSVWSARTDRYSEERSRRPAAGEEKVEMYQIGG